MRKIISLIIAIAIVVVAGISTTAAEGNITVKINGSIVNFPDQVPYIDSNNRTQVPVRFVSEALGAAVAWEENAQKQTVTIRKSTDTIILKIGQSKATVNGVEKSFDTAASLKGDRTFVPLRFISEALGASVSWIEVTKTVEITTNSNSTPSSSTTEYNGYKLPANHIMEIFDASSIKGADLSTRIMLDSNLDGFNRACDEMENVLASKFDKDIAKSAADYCRSKSNNRAVELPVKIFETSDKYTIEIFSGCGSISVSVSVFKPGINN